MKPQINKEEIAQSIRDEAYLDPVMFCRTFLPDWFPPESEVPWFHMGIMALLDRNCQFLLNYGEKNLRKIMKHFYKLDDPTNPKSERIPIFYWGEDGQLCMQVSRYNSVMMPRGFSKTTICNAMVMKKIVYRERNFIVYISEAGPHAETQLGSIKRNLESNEMLLSVYGNLKPGREDGKKWNADWIQTANGVNVVARGRGGQVRGLNTNGQRPDEIVIDDLEDRESVKTPEQRRKAQEYAYADVLPALPRGDKSATITALGTLLHPEAVMEKFAQDPDFNSVRFGAIDEDGDALWDSQYGMTLPEIEAKKKTYALVGQLGMFYREYMSLIRNDETAKFKEEYIRYQPIDRSECSAVALIIDPAISDKIDADVCALAVVGMTPRGVIHLLDYYGKRGMTPRDQVDKYFELHNQWQPDYHGIESISYQAALVHLVREEMFRKGTYFEITPITHSTKKTERVEGVLQPRYAAGYIVHQRKFVEYEAMLLDWPNGKLDGPDAVAMAVTLLDPHAAEAADPDKDLAEDYYPPLDEVYGGDWRSMRT